jgi:hypothetical protein
VADRELIVEFLPGVAEDQARGAAAAAGATVRRKMQSDPDRVILLVKISADQLDAAERSLGQDSRVARTERNDPNYGAS